jgi:hypothetical protein
MTTSPNKINNVPLRMGSGRPSDPKKDKSTGGRPADPKKEGEAGGDLEDDPDSQTVGRPADPKKKPSILIGGGRPADPEKPPEK